MPIISASVSWLILAAMGSGLPSFPKLAISRSTRGQSLLGRIEELIHEVFLDPRAPSQNVGEKHLRERGLVMKNPHNLGLCHPQHDAFGHRHCRCEPLGLSDQASLPQEFVRAEKGDDCLSPSFGEHADFDVALSDVETESASSPWAKMIAFLGCVEMTRPLAAVSRNFTGSKRARACDLRLGLFFAVPDLGASDICGLVHSGGSSIVLSRRCLEHGRCRTLCQCKLSDMPVQWGKSPCRIAA
jgi:hypothetical protein